MSRTVTSATNTSSTPDRARTLSGLRPLRRLLLAFVAGLVVMVALPGVALAYTDPGRPESTTAVVDSHQGPAVPVTGGAGTGAASTSLTWLVPTLSAVLALIAVVGVALVLRHAARRGTPRASGAGI